jgi:hypothetical protein
MGRALYRLVVQNKRVVIEASDYNEFQAKLNSLFPGIDIPREEVQAISIKKARKK